ncbi:unnamed protein product [Durusdinium trenchii]|uniref:Uncharacterized protein n=1 Tax=Durusdinium trenchii TaxID=1381693 RepID=A0ABP0P3E0_9DINO
MTQERCPFRPYEDFADEGDLSRPEGCGDSFEEHLLEGSNGQHGASRGFQSLDGTCHAPGDCRANSTPIDIFCPGVVQSFVPIFGENKVTKNFTPDSGDYTTGENTATPDAFDKDGCCIAFPWEEPNDYTVLMQRFPIEQQRVPFARASERGLPIRHALELSRRVFTPIWMLEGRDVAFEYFRSAEQGIWQKKVLGWKFLGYDQEIGLPFSIQLLPRGLWATQLIGHFEDDDVLTVFFVVVTPQPTMMHHADPQRGLHDVVTIAMESEAYASDRLPLMIQYDLEGIIVQTAVRCPIACTPIMICDLLQLDERCQPPYEVRISYRDDYVERFFVKYERIGLPAGSFVHLSTYIRDEQCEWELPQQYPLREHQVLILASDANFDNRHDVSDGGREAQLDLPHGQESDTVDFMQDPDIRSTRHRKLGGNDEDTSLMQVGLPAHDLVTRYMENLELQYDAIEVAVWYHPLVLMGQKATFVRWATFLIGYPGGPFVRGIWSRALGRGPCYVYPVRPMPEQGGRAGPQFIVTNFVGENVLPALVIYRGDEGNSRTFTYIFDVRQWPTMMEIFDAVIPDHGCVWDSDCVLVMGPFDAERAYTWNMRVELYEGAYLRLRETARDIPPHVWQDDGGTTCGTETHTDSASDSERGEATSSSHSSTSRTAVEGDHLNADEEVEGETGGSPLWMMQFAWELEMAKDEEDFLAGAEEVHLASMEKARYRDLLHLDGHLQGEGDVMRNFLREIFPCDGLKVFTVHLWLLEHEITAFARVVPLFQGKSMTKAVIHELGPISDSSSFWVTAAKPMPPPLSLRICPIDLVVLNSKQRAEGLRIYLIDILFRRLPKRVAVAYRRGERLLDIVRKCDLAEACDPTKHHCILSRTDDEGKREWELPDEVDEVHGSSFELGFMPPKKQKWCEHDETTMMQLQTAGVLTTPSQVVDAYMEEWTLQGNEATLWLHNDYGARVQEHPLTIDVIADRDFLDGLGRDDLGIADEIFPVRPPPIFIIRPRPHVIFVQGGRHDLVPILCQLFMDLGHDLKSLLVESRTNMIELKKIFDLASPGHGCEQRQHCYAVFAGARLPYLGTMDVQIGTFIRLFLLERQDDEHSTCCSVGTGASSDTEGEESDDLGTIGSDLQLIHWGMQLGDGENTATPRESAIDDYLYSDQCLLLGDGVHGDNTATPTDCARYTALFEPSYDDFSMFQRVLHLAKSWTPHADDQPQMRGPRQIVWDHMLLWQAIHRTDRYTRFHQFPSLLEEAIAFRRARGYWQEIVISGMIHHVLGYWEIALEDDFSFTMQELQNRLRTFVRIRSCMIDDATDDGRLRRDGSDEEMILDEVGLMQMGVEERNAQSTGEAGLSRLTLLEHRVRLQKDQIYRLLADYHEPDGMQPVSGILVSFWLLKGEMPVVQKSEKKLLLHTVVPDWTQWVEQDWLDKGLSCSYALVKQYVTSNGPERSDYHVLGTSAHDRDRGFQTILIDLTFDNIRNRGAVRYPILATVAEIVVLFVGGPLQVQHGILGELELHWRGQGGVYVFKAMETPAIPNAAFVHIVKKGRPLPAQCFQEQFRFDEEGELVLMQLGSSYRLARELRTVNDPLYRLLVGSRRSSGVEDLTANQVTLWKLTGSTSQALLEAEQFTLHSDSDSWSVMVDPMWVNDGQNVFSLVQPMPVSSVPHMVHVFETPLRSEWKYALVDLLLRNQHVRAAVAYGPSDTVLDIYRIIAYGRYRLQRLLSTSLYLSWEAPETTFYYLATQVPRLPDGAYVVMRIGELPVQACEDAGGLSLLQQGVVKIKSIEPLEGKGAWRRHPVVGLRPPGNPVQWLNLRMESMDDCFFLWNTDVVVDFPLLHYETGYQIPKGLTSLTLHHF